MMNNDAALQRYVPLVCWMAVLLTAGVICLKILSYGFIPAGDARRHVAKPFANKPYSEIVVMRPQYVVDHSPGWEWFLGEAQRVTGWDEDGLISLSFVSMGLMVLCFPLIWMRHPEAWMAAVLAETVAIPDLMTRWGQARPYLLSEGILMALLFSWTKEGDRNPRWWKVAATCAGFCLSVWIHGAWYLWVLLFIAFFLAQRWRAGLWLGGCWLVGTAAGALLTGKPIAFLNGGIFMARCVYEEQVPKWMLVGEFQPSTGEITTVAALAIVYLWLRPRNKSCQGLARQPVFWMILINWVLGLTADRFWADWGVAAAVVWMATQFDEAMPAFWEGSSVRRLVACGFIVVSLYLLSTNDMGRRYTKGLSEAFVEGSDPALKGWMPGKGGIFYADNMQFFYNTFYKNPRGDWRYIVGFEPALMPTNDLAVYRDLQRRAYAIEAYQPWVKKMRPIDRLAMTSGTAPNLPVLEWKWAAGNVWIGRLPVSTNAAAHP